MKNKKDNLKGLSKEELNKMLNSIQEEARVLRFKSQGSKSKNVKEVSVLKKKIARVLTAINQINKK